MYKNPILYADYSDPDVIRVGEDYYMVASSFTYLPGVPILHSKDLVHWEIINYCVWELPFDRYNQPAHGSGTWAPAIRHHNGMFYVFIPLPDEGIFVARSEDIYGKFTLNCLHAAKGWIDPCPYWDTDGRAYMVFAYARSRCGIKHRLSLVEIDPDCTRILGEPQVIFHEEALAPTIEGPKLYRRGEFYYILAPAGGVETGWQVALRSKNIWGPYEYKVVLSQGNTAVNGPHQGGWVEAVDGRHWFLHFQDVGTMGRITHLQPVTWVDGWPVMGAAEEPVEAFDLPAKNMPHYAILTCDDFAGEKLGLQWQWQANPQARFYEMAKPGLRLFCLANPERESLLWYAPNALTQIPQSPDLTATAKVTLRGEKDGDLAAIGFIGHRYAYCALERTNRGNVLRVYTGKATDIQQAGQAEEQLAWELPWEADTAYLRVTLTGGQTYRFYYSADGESYQPIGDALPLEKATWTGAKLCLWCANRKNTESLGCGEYAWFRVE